MARASINEIILDTVTGRPVTNASVLVTVRNTGLAATIYTGSVGLATTPNPLLTQNGRLIGWLEEGSYALIVTGAFAAQTINFEAVNADFRLQTGGGIIDGGIPSSTGSINDIDGGTPGAV